MSDGDASQQAAALAESLIVDFAKEGNPGALAIIEEAQAAEPAEEPAVEAEPEAPAQTFNLNPDLPEDLAAELAEAEIEEEVEREIAAYEPETDEWGNPVEVDQAALREAAKLRKRNEYLERQLVQTKRGQWEAEAEKFFPLAKHSLADINASSRRGFLKAAKAEHDRILPHVQAYLSDAKAFVAGEAEVVKNQTRETQKEAWGTPLSGPEASLSTSAENHQAAVDKARAGLREGKGSLKDVFAAMMRG